LFLILTEYTSARSPLEYCYAIESPPEKFIILNPIGKFNEIANPKYIRPLTIRVHQGTIFESDPSDQSASSYDEIDNLEYIQPSTIRVYKEIIFQSNPNNQLASSSGAVKSIRDFDLNEIPSDEDE